MNRITIMHPANPVNPVETLSTPGFTLLETTIAMVVMMIAVLGALSVFAYCIRNNSAANDRELAMAVAQQKLEQLRSVSFTDSSLDATPTTGTTTTITRAGRQYSVLTQIVHSNTVNGSPTVKTITVQVTPKGTALGAVILSTLRTTTVVGPNR
jgi:type II secretion system protein I